MTPEERKAYRNLIEEVDQASDSVQRLADELEEAKYVLSVLKMRLKQMKRGLVNENQCI